MGSGSCLAGGAGWLEATAKAVGQGVNGGMIVQNFLDGAACSNDLPWMEEILHRSIHPVP